ncbi:glycosyltransferase family 2 protein [Mucilaginibacter sp. CSA2-8R]|uniref:glycosyltransferase family 2 protein n=1 Tax=Mucilaginibacter sp. CSA2-8R TaxID=3141542 RepID=UPI00315D65D2
MYQDRIFIVLVNYGGHLDTTACIESILKCRDNNVQIIVIDNSPESSSIDYIKSWADQIDKTNDSDSEPSSLFSFINIDVDDFLQLKQELYHQVILVSKVENKGFAAANNVALRYLIKSVNFTWVWLLNNDTIIPEDTLKNIRLGLSNVDDNVGIVGTKIYYHDKPDLLQGVGGKYNKFFSTSVHVGSNQNDFDYNSKEFRKNVDYIIGASMIVRKDLIKDVGLMNESYFLYYEELDWTLRSKSKGWYIDLLPKVHIYHKEGATISKNQDRASLLSDKCLIVNRVKLSKKFFPAYLIFVYFSLIIVLTRRITRGQTNRLKPILLALIHQNPLY